MKKSILAGLLCVVAFPLVAANTPGDKALKAALQERVAAAAMPQIQCPKRVTFANIPLTFTKRDKNICQYQMTAKPGSKDFLDYNTVSATLEVELLEDTDEALNQALYDFLSRSCEKESSKATPVRRQLCATDKENKIVGSLLQERSTGKDSEIVTLNRFGDKTHVYFSLILFGGMGSNTVQSLKSYWIAQLAAFEFPVVKK